jgi:hypothetical protein
MPTLAIQKISFQQRISALAKNLRRYFLGQLSLSYCYTFNNLYGLTLISPLMPIRVGGLTSFRIVLGVREGAIGIRGGFVS